MPDTSTMPRLLIFDDGGGAFGPLTDHRATFDLRAGVVSNRVRIETALGQMACDLRVRPQQVAVRRLRETDALVNAPLRRAGPITFHAFSTACGWEPVTVAGDMSVLCVNGRWPGDATLPTSPLPEDVAELPVGHALTQADGQVIAAHLSCDAAERWLGEGSALPAGAAARVVERAVLVNRPWDLVNRLETILPADLAAFDASVAPTAKVHPTAVLDETRGRIVIDEGATVGANAVIEGPCYVGRGAVVSPLAYLRPPTVIGEGCKVAGEISASILHAFTNKTHYGYLGNSIVGEWCNLGAGTTVSNLKNTYGEVRMQLAVDAPPEPTGRQFFGPVIGDFVRTAIGTRIVSGSCIGTASMLAVSGFAPKFVPAGRFITDDGDEAVEPDKLIATVRAMLARRGMELAEADEAILRVVTSRG